jgi:serine/threonine protein kinase
MASGRSKYILGERIAQGGMAEIYLGKIVGSEGFTRLCAFKKVLPSFVEDQEFMEMFRNEAMVAKQLQNKNIVQVYDFESDFDQGPMLVMEYVDGQDLRSILRDVEKQKLKIPVELAAYITAESLNGLGFAHASVDMSGKSLGIIHRDVSPQNIMVSFEGDVKITDFGIAKVQSAASNTRAGVLKGKFRYMAPEQASGDGVDARSDVFAMGIVLYEMLTMTRLFKGDDDFQILQAVRECKVRSPNEVKGVSIPSELESIVFRLMAKDPSERYQTARDAVKDLTRFLYSYKKDFFPGELAEFMQQLFASKLDAARDRMRSTLAIPVDAVNDRLSQSFGSGNFPEFLAGASTPSEGAASRLGSHNGNALPIEMSSPHQGGNGGGDHNIFSVQPISKDIQLEKNSFGDGQNPRASASGKINTNLHRPMRKTTLKVMDGDRSITRKKPSRGRKMETFFIVLAVFLALGIAGFFVALNKRLLRFPTHLELKPYMEAQKRVKVRVDGKPYRGGAWVDLPIKLTLEWGNHVILVSKPGFKDYRLELSAPIIGNSLWRTTKVESVLLGKDSPLGNILILTEPENAKISVDDNQFTGVSGRQIEFIPVGKRYKIRIDHPRCSPLITELDMPKNAGGEIVTRQFSLRGCR